MSGIIIKFYEMIRSFQHITVIKEENKIKIIGYAGWMEINLNQNEEKQCEKNLKNNILNFLRRRKNLKIVKEITKEQCKKMILDNIKEISFNNFPNEFPNKVWEEIQEDIFQSKNFKYYVFKEKECVFIGSYLYTVKIS